MLRRGSAGRRENSMSEARIGEITEYTAEDVTAACMALRRAIGREPSKLSASEFIRRLRADILLGRDAGLNDDEIAAIIQRATGRHVTLQEMGDVAVEVADVRLA